MNDVTIAIPRRWGNASAQILRFFSDPERLRTAAINGFQIKETVPLDEGQIWTFESSLDASQAIFLDAAITSLNTALNATTSEGWRLTKEVTEQAQRDVEEIESIRVSVAGLN